MEGKVRKMIQNATVTSTELGGDERGPSFWLHLDYGGSSQGFGGYRLGGEFTNYVVMGILDTLEVASWEKLKGTPVRAKIEDGTIVSIGHYIKEQWFTPKEWRVK